MEGYFGYVTDFFLSKIVPQCKSFPDEMKSSNCPADEIFTLNLFCVVGGDKLKEFLSRSLSFLIVLLV